MASRDCLRTSEIDRFIDDDGFLISDEGSEIDGEDYIEREEQSSDDESDSEEESDAEENPSSPVVGLPPVDLVAETIEDVVAILSGGCGIYFIGFSK